VSKQNKSKAGNIELIFGSMFSGKTKLLIKKIKHAQKNNLKITVFKPKIDIRYDKEKIVSHEKNKFKAIPILNPLEIIAHSKDSNLVAIDEVQFFNNDIVRVCSELSKKRINIIIAGLDLDYLGKPFGAIPKLMKIADKLTHLHAICDICKKEAYHTYRISNNNKKIVLGEKETYLALCKNCFNLKLKKHE
jgi:thymidine kinase